MGVFSVSFADKSGSVNAGTSVAEDLLTGGEESGHVKLQMAKSPSIRQPMLENFPLTAREGTKSFTFKRCVGKKRTSLFYDSKVYQEGSELLFLYYRNISEVLIGDAITSPGEKTLSWSRILIVGLMMIVFFLNVTLPRREHHYDDILIFLTVCIINIIPLLLSSVIHWNAIVLLFWIGLSTAGSAYANRDLKLYKAHFILYCFILFYFLP